VARQAGSIGEFDEECVKKPAKYGEIEARNCEFSVNLSDFF
jgi:hypothetical protein